MFSLLYYLGFLTRKETLPLSKDFFSAEGSSSVETVLDLKEVNVLRSQRAEKGSSSYDQKELNQLYQLKLDKGIRNLSTLSFALIREAKKSREKGDLKRATDLVTFASRFSPDLPHPYFEQARLHWRQKPFRIDEILPKLLEGFKAIFRYYPSSLNFYYHVFYILSNAVLMAFIVFGIVILWRHLTLYFYDIRKNLTQELPSLVFNGLKVFVLFIPFFLRLDLLWSILFWSILLWGYLTQKERQFTVIFLIVLVYVPFFLRTSTHFLNSPFAEILLEIHEANHENWDKGTEEKLRNWSLSYSGDAEVFFTLGLIEKRKGRYAQAEDLYRKAIDRAPNMSDAYSNLGNVYLAQKQIPLAIASYHRAIELNPNRGSYHFNLYRAYSQETFLSRQSDRAFQKARQLDPKLVEYYHAIDSPNLNRLVIDETLSAKALWERMMNQFIGREGLLFRLFKAWFEAIPSALPMLAPIVFLAYLIGMSRYTRTKRFLTRCPMCGSATHRFYLGTADLMDQKFVCFNCYRLFVQKEKLHPKITEKKSEQVKSFQRQEQVTGKMLSYLLIGFGHLWRGESLKGLFLLTLFFIFILRFVFWGGVLPSVGPPSSFPWGSLIFWGILFCLFYVLAYRQNWQRKPDFEIPI